MFWQFPNNVELCLLNFEGEGKEEEVEEVEVKSQWDQVCSLHLGRCISSSRLHCGHF